MMLPPSCFTSDHRVRGHFIALVASLMAGPVAAATYYVDAVSGRDTNNGLSATTTAEGNGPWQSLDRISKTTLQPGDQVLLQCGQLWKGNLAVNGNGTSTRSVRISSYPEGCQDKPILDGGNPIPSSQWVLEQGGIYKASLKWNLIPNGRMTNGLSGWTLYSEKSDATMAVQQNCAPGYLNCVNYRSGTGVRPSLLTSSTFTIESGKTYEARALIKLPKGTIARIVVRRNSPPYDMIGLYNEISATGNWDQISKTFTASSSISNARFDLEIPGGSIFGQFANFSVEPQGSVIPEGLLAYDGSILNPAHHPNAGHNPSLPGSVYLNIPTNANRITNTAGTLGSNYIPTDSALSSIQSQLTPGITVYVKTYPWILESKTVTDISAGRLTLDSTTRYPVSKDFGYYLEGASWMLDSAGEWFADRSWNTLRLWMPDSQHPGSRVSMINPLPGISIERTTNIEISNLTISGYSIGILADRAMESKFIDLEIRNINKEGISIKGSRYAIVQRSQFYRTRGDAIVASDSVGAMITENNVIQSGILRGPSGSFSTPRPSAAAILSGNEALVRNNRIQIAAYNGIRGGRATTIEENSVSETCVVLNDCGGIYVSTESPFSTIKDNIVENLYGNLNGVPESTLVHAVGIYLDNAVEGVTVSGNTIHDADYGIQAHNAHLSYFTSNLLYGNRRYQMWFQESTKNLRSDGDIYGNVVSGNFLFPSVSAPSIRLESPLTSVTDFGVFGGNRFSALLSDQIVTTSSPSGFASYDLESWNAFINQLSSGTGGAGLSAVSISTTSDQQLSQARYAPILTVGSSILSNGNMSGGIDEWAVWNQTAPLASLSLENCGAIGSCLRLRSGGSVSLLSSPNFSIEEGKRYRVSFDMRVGTEGTSFTPVVRRGGPSSYEKLMPEIGLMTGSTSWRRYSFTFVSTRTVVAGGPTSNEFGARLDFEKVPAARDVWVANVEIVPTAQQTTSLITHYLSNPGREHINVTCPEAGGANDDVCGSFLDFETETEIAWPLSLAPRSAKIIFSRDSSLVDSDGDGVPDVQDTCTGTLVGLAVNARGCSIQDQLSGR
ncbi:right-handed parallel beta-helix repeat-containing protein [Methyloversatilis sp. MC4-4]|uniref:right-handed parallel beta-helix repeat-containing protein n=1 Tax=Methyloversatilis sp. MC4-4 TaxID=3132824 RepID=UPI003CEBC7D7